MEEGTDHIEVIFVDKAQEGRMRTWLRRTPLRRLFGLASSPPLVKLRIPQPIVPLYPQRCLLIGKSEEYIESYVGQPEYRGLVSPYPGYRRDYLVIASPDVSRCHAMIAFDRSSETYQVTDLDSTNFTYFCDVFDRPQPGCYQLTDPDALDVSLRERYVRCQQRLPARQPLRWQGTHYLRLGKSTLVRLDQDPRRRAEQKEKQVKEAKTVWITGRL